ncbi:MAG: P-loop NTPase fold protein [Pseudomonadota bacterium]
METMASGKSEGESRTSTPVFVFVGRTGDVGANYFHGSKVGDVVGWRNGTDAYMRTMQPGDIAAFYITGSKQSPQIKGLGVVVSSREPFLLDTEEYQDAQGFVQRIPILITNLFEDNPISVPEMQAKTGEVLVKTNGAIHIVQRKNREYIRQYVERFVTTPTPFSMHYADKGRAVAQSNLQRYVEESTDLAAFSSYMSRQKRRELLQSGDTPSGDLSTAEALSALNAIWSVGGLNLLLVPDHPAEVREQDRLQRYPMAKILASRMQTVFGDSKVADAASKKKESVAPFTILVDSPWGGGKSTFANFLIHVLSNPDRTQSGDKSEEQRQPWTIVTFNAWRHQHVKPVWWVLFGYILNSLRQRRERQGGIYRSWSFWLSQRIWQFWTWSNALALLAWLTACLTALIIYGSGDAGKNGGGFSSGDAVGVLGLLGLLGLPIVASIRSVVINVGNSLHPGRAAKEENYSLGKDDPLERFRQHFRKTLDEEDTPILLVIDDLDRCQAEFVVDLVQGLQTLLRSHYMFVVLLGDRAWIERCFDVQFAAMTDAEDTENIDRLGQKFVEKALQMSLTLPSPTQKQQESLLQSITASHVAASEVPLATGQPSVSGDSPGNAETANGDRDVGAGVDDIEVNSSAEEILEPDTLRSNEENWAEAQSLVDGARDEIFIQHTIIKYAGLFPSNPRQIKRIVNTISFYQAVARGLGLIQSEDERWEKFYVWVIAYVAYFDNWRDIASSPEKLDSLRAQRAATGAESAFFDLLDLQVGAKNEGLVDRI